MVELDPEGTERYRFEGYLPVDEFLPQLELGLGQIAFARKQWAEAEQRFRGILLQFPKSEVAPEALYWAGVAKYKATGDAAALADTARKFKEKYPDSVWAKKASVWAPKAASG